MWKSLDTLIFDESNPGTNVYVIGFIQPTELGYSYHTLECPKHRYEPWPINVPSETSCDDVLQPMPATVEFNSFSRPQGDMSDKNFELLSRV